MLVLRSKPLLAFVVATLVGVLSYLALTAGMRAVRSSAVDTATAPGTVPEFVYNAPQTVPTTADYGPVGRVSMVFAGTDVLTGLSGQLDNPWIAISSQTGDYRALSAPHLPEPASGAVAVSPDGATLAWGFGEGVVLYDPVEDEAREVVEGVGGDPLVGPFSPDGRLLAVYDGSLRVLEVESGEVAATLSGVDEEAARQAVWTPDGAALSYVATGRLVTHAWQSDNRAATPAPVTAGATLAWQPSGEQLATMREGQGGRSVEVFDVAVDGRLRLARTVQPDGYAQHELLGFTSDTRVAVIALTLDSGAVGLVYRMSTVDTSPPTQVTQLAGEGTNWSGQETLEVAAQPLAGGSAAFDEPSWPWSELSKIVGSILCAVFAFGLFLTRRTPRRVRRG